MSSPTYLNIVTSFYCGAFNKMSKKDNKSGMDHFEYTLHPGGINQQRQDLTPHSAVSSFNEPIQYGPNLITPVSMTGSPSIGSRAELGGSASEPRLLPGPLSPFGGYFAHEEEDFPSRCNDKMKNKDPLNPVRYSNSDPYFDHQYSPQVPYYGSYAVSAKNLDSSPNVLPSPRIISAGGNSTGSFHSYQQTPPLSATSSASYMSHEAPILNAPNPLTLRPSVKKEQFPFTLSPHGHNNTRPSPPMGKKRKSPEISKSDEEVWLPAELAADDRLLLELVLPGEDQWKVIAATFCEKTGQDLRIPTLQMRKRRLLERLMENAITGIWTDWTEERWDILIAKCGKNTNGKDNWDQVKKTFKVTLVNQHRQTFAEEENTTPRPRRASRKSSSASQRRGSTNRYLVDDEYMNPAERRHTTTDPSAHQHSRQRTSDNAYTPLPHSRIYPDTTQHQYHLTNTMFGQRQNSLNPPHEHSPQSRGW